MANDPSTVLSKGFNWTVRIVGKLDLMQCPLTYLRGEVVVLLLADMCA